MRIGLCLMALVAGLCLVATLPASADNNNNGNGKSHGQLLGSAERACRQTAQNKGYDVRGVSGSRRTGNNSARVDLRLRRKGTSYDGRCSYDGRSDRASLDVQGGGNDGGSQGKLLQSAERACRRTAQNKGYDVRGVSNARASGNNAARVDLRLRRKDTNYDARCSYDRRDDRASLDIQRGNGNGGNNGHRDNGDLDKRIKEACWKPATARREKLTGFGKVQPDGRNYKVQVTTWRDGTTYRYWCLYDRGSRSAELRPR